VKGENLPLSFYDVPIVILCGGKSSRMGENKTYLPFGGCNSLIEFQYKRLSQVFKRVFVSSKTPNFDFLEPQTPWLLLDNNPHIYSPLAAIKSVLEQLNTSQLFILTVDTPFVSVKTIQTIIENAQKYDITIAYTSEKNHHLCGVFSQSLRSKIESMLEKDIHKIGYLIQQSHTHKIQFDSEEEFLNMNTQSDYREALNRLKNCQKLI
jgi:molybdenum cofactor guanylyltransferase